MPITRPTLQTFDDRGTEDGSTVRASLGIGLVSHTRKMFVDWADAGKAAQHVLGYSRIARDGGGNPTRLERLLPACHPDDPTLMPVRLTLTNSHAFQTARGADGSTWGSDTNRLNDQSIGAAYSRADVEVEYERSLYVLKEDAEVAAGEEYKRFVDWGEPEPAADVLTIPGHALKYVAAPFQIAPAGFPLSIAFNVPMVQPKEDLQVTWKRLPADFYTPGTDDPGPWVLRLYGDPWASTPRLPYYGTVNKTAFSGYPAGTLLLTGVKLIRKPGPFVQYVPNSDPALIYYVSPAVEWDVQFSMRYSPYGHNYTYYNHIVPLGTTNRSGYYHVSRSGTYHAPGAVPDGDSLFNEREFRHLFDVRTTIS